jgi:hypothetical protein
VAEGIDLVAIVFARVGINDGNWRRYDKTCCVTDRGRGTSCSLGDSFPEADLRIRQNLASRNGLADELHDLRVLGESSMPQLVRRRHASEIDDLYPFPLKGTFERLLVGIDGAKPCRAPYLARKCERPAVWTGASRTFRASGQCLETGWMAAHIISRDWLLRKGIA